MVTAYLNKSVLCFAFVFSINYNLNYRLQLKLPVSQIHFILYSGNEILHYANDTMSSAVHFTCAFPCVLLDVKG